MGVIYWLGKVVIASLRLCLWAPLPTHDRQVSGEKELVDATPAKAWITSTSYDQQHQPWPHIVQGRGPGRVWGGRGTWQCAQPGISGRSSSPRTCSNHVCKWRHCVLWKAKRLPNLFVDKDIFFTLQSHFHQEGSLSGWYIVGWGFAPLKIIKVNTFGKPIPFCLNKVRLGYPDLVHCHRRAPKGNDQGNWGLAQGIGKPLHRHSLAKSKGRNEREWFLLRTKSMDKDRAAKKAELLKKRSKPEKNRLMMWMDPWLIFSPWSSVINIDHHGFCFCFCSTWMREAESPLCCVGSELGRCIWTRFET